MDRTSSILTGGVTVTAATLAPLVTWGLNGFPHPVPDSVPYLIAAVAVTIGHAIFNVVQSRSAANPPAQPPKG